MSATRASSFCKGQLISISAPELPTGQNGVAQRGQLFFPLALKSGLVCAQHDQLARKHEALMVAKQLFFPSPTIHLFRSHLFSAEIQFSLGAAAAAARWKKTAASAHN